MRSRLSFAFTVPQALQVLLLGNHMGARVTSVWRHWPLASSSRASTPYPRHLARALDFPGSAHPRQERGGATLTQNRVTAPDDDAGYVDPEGDHQVGIRIPFRGPWCQPRGTSAWTRGRPHGTQAAPHGGWVAQVVEVDGVLHAISGGKSGNRPSGLMPPACCICFGGHGVPLDNDQRG